LAGLQASHDFVNYEALDSNPMATVHSRATSNNFKSQQKRQSNLTNLNNLATNLNYIQTT
jgi:hypothetical protein